MATKEKKSLTLPAIPIATYKTGGYYFAYLSAGESSSSEEDQKLTYRLGLTWGVGITPRKAGENFLNKNMKELIVIQEKEGSAFSPDDFKLNPEEERV